MSSLVDVLSDVCVCIICCKEEGKRSNFLLTHFFPALESSSLPHVVVLIEIFLWLYASSTNNRYFILRMRNKHSVVMARHEKIKRVLLTKLFFFAMDFMSSGEKFSFSKVSQFFLLPLWHDKNKKWGKLGSRDFLISKDSWKL